SMGVVDTIMVGHLPHSAVPLSAAALAQVFFNTLAFGVGGILLGLDTTIAQAHGADDFPGANRWFGQGLLLCSAISLLQMVLLGVLAPLGLTHLRTDPTVLRLAIPTLRALTWGIFPLLLYFTMRRYLQAFNHVRLIAATLVSANLVNALFDWLLIFGHRWQLGSVVLEWAPRGVVGSGIATSLARVYQAIFLIGAILWVDRRNRYGLLADMGGSLRPHWQSLRRLLILGGPAGATILVEILVFAVVTGVIAMLGPVPLAGHEIALNCISFSFMIPLGISAAASVRVGQAIGRGAAEEARVAGGTAIALGAGAMALCAVVYLAVPYGLAAVFTHDAGVIGATVPLFFIAAVFQFFDGLQVTATGALRGLGDTHSAFLTHLCSYWLLGLPLGLYLCFPLKLGARGLWMGLCASLLLTGMVLLARWRRQIGRVRVAVPAG
ncbi:MAG TPA: MATE family efflux transporter, partial [Rhodanobacter sp.]